MRRRPGIAGLQRDVRAREQYKAAGEAVKRDTVLAMRDSMGVFKSKLEEFARLYKNDIRKDPVFRAQFHVMCANIGVDPLASTKGIWAELLGFGDFYYELGVQIVEACWATRSHNGGMMELNALLTYVTRRRGSLADAISSDDVVRAIQKLKVLGNGFDLVKLGPSSYVRSVPGELSMDTSRVLELAQGRGCLSVSDLVRTAGWTQLRAEDALAALLKQELAMIDDGAPDGVRLYWFPCISVPMRS